MLTHLSVTCLVLWAYAAANRGVPVSERLPIDNFCFRRLNDTHQFGCTSAYDGNVGVVHVVSTAKDIDYVVSEGPSSQYVPVVKDVDLSVASLGKFVKSGRVAGVLVLFTGKKPEAFSPDDTCPNRYSSHYKNGESCQRNNIKGNQMTDALVQDYPFPIFYLKNSTLSRKVLDCFHDFNEDTTSYSLFERRKCSLKMYAPMNAAVSTKTCMRRSQINSYFTLPIHFCDPLESQNVFALLNATEPANETVIVAARMDSFSLFTGLAPGADSAVSGVVSLLSLANSLTKWESSTKRNKNVLFALFNGEAFDYIGSSRCVYDLLHGRFKYNLTLSNITSIIELNQLFLEGPKQNKWFAHVDAEQYADENIRKKLNPILENLRKSGRIENVTDADLPVSSVRQFLNVERTIASIVVTNFNHSFVNPYYNSIFDAYGHRVKNLTLQARKLQPLIADVGNTILQMIHPPDATFPPVQVDEQLIEDLLGCYLVNSSCARFRAVVNPLSTALLSDEPHPLYVSVSPTAGMVSPSTVLTYLTLAHITGEAIGNVTSEKDCFILQEKYPFRSYTWMFGDKPTDAQPGICVLHSTTMTTARSPAFDGASTSKNHPYSTWTESVWSQPEMSLFVQASGRDQLTALIIGITVFLTSLLLSILIYRRSEEIFVQQATCPESSMPVAC